MGGISAFWAALRGIRLPRRDPKGSTSRVNPRSFR
jgi:hypothetical protein